jgi:hypothetical protein
LIVGIAVLFYFLFGKTLPSDKDESDAYDIYR